MAICQKEEQAAGRPYPRTCPTCKLGPCSRSAMTTDPKDAEIARLTADLRLVITERDETFATMLDRAEKTEAALSESQAAEEGAMMILAQTIAERDAARKALSESQALLAMAFEVAADACDNYAETVHDDPFVDGSEAWALNQIGEKIRACKEAIIAKIKEAE